MGYKLLDYLKRCKILGMWKAGHTQAQIAIEVGVHQSTISREFNRNMTYVELNLVHGNINLIMHKAIQTEDTKKQIKK